VVFSSEKYIYFSVALSKHYCLFENHNHQVWLNQWCKFGAVLSLWPNNGRPDFETIYFFFFDTSDTDIRQARPFTSTDRNTYVNLCILIV